MSFLKKIQADRLLPMTDADRRHEQSRLITPKDPKYRKTDAFDHAEVGLNIMEESIPGFIAEIKKLDANHPLLLTMTKLKAEINTAVKEVRKYQT